MDDFLLGIFYSGFFSFVIGLINPALSIGKTREKNTVITLIVSFMSFLLFGLVPSGQPNASLGFLGMLVFPIYSLIIFIKNKNSLRQDCNRNKEVEEKYSGCKNLQSSKEDVAVKEVLEEIITEKEIDNEQTALDANNHEKLNDIDIEPVELKISKEKKIMMDEFEFPVAGVTMKNDSGENIQSLIRSMVKTELEYTDAYEGMSNQDIRDYMHGVRVYEINILGYDGVSLVPEPDNIYDSNAIKVFIQDIGHVGYVPKKDNIGLSKIINNDHVLEWSLVGGKFKYADEEDNIQTITYTYGLRVKVRYNKLFVED